MHQWITIQCNTQEFCSPQLPSVTGAATDTQVNVELDEVVGWYSTATKWRIRYRWKYFMESITWIGTQRGVALTRFLVVCCCSRTIVSSSAAVARRQRNLASLVYLKQPSGMILRQNSCLKLFLWHLDIVLCSIGELELRNEAFPSTCAQVLNRKRKYSASSVLAWGEFAPTLSFSQ